MRNNIYCNRFILNDTDIEENTSWIRYVNENVFKSEVWCHKVCETIQRQTCEILNHFKNLRVPNRNYFIEKDKFWDEKEKYKRKLK